MFARASVWSAPGHISLRKVAQAWVLTSVLWLAGSEVRSATFTVTNANDSGPGTLRTAISNANFFAGADLINFNLSGSPAVFTISLLNNLPAITDPVMIDGTTQSGYINRPRIELNGAGVPGTAIGFYLLSSNSTVKGLAINRFGQHGILIEGAGGNTIQGNFIGTGAFGTNSLGNGLGSSGFGAISIRSANNVIGGTEVTNRNLISGSNFHGIFLDNVTARSNRIVGNYIGLDVTGTKRLGNVNHGILIAGAHYTMVGGSTPGARNVISGNYRDGVHVLGGGSLSNIIQGNFIGTDAAGTAAISNSVDGIILEGGVGTLIGGTNAGAGNVISGNGGRGVSIYANGATGTVIQGNRIGTDATGMARLGNAFSGVDIFNASGNTVGGSEPGARNVISANGLSGVSINDVHATANVVQGNFLGTDLTGTNALGNLRNGVFISGVTNNLIGGTNAGAGNVISGNAQNGVQLVEAGARNNRVQGNYIGTDIAGTRRVGNGTSGVRIEAPGNLLGGTTPGVRNLISANTNSGVYVLGLVASNNVIQGNYIGTALSGLTALSNRFSGITLEHAPDNVIGGTASGAGNLISGNSLNGLVIQGLGAAGNLVQGNFIGTDATGNSALPNGFTLGSQGTPVGGGIDIAGAPSNLIGGSDPGAGNIISGNWRDGLCIGDAGATNNVIQGNLIGTKADGVSALGNETHGIDIRAPGGANNNLIGGATPGAGNVIAHTLAAGVGYDGVRVRDGNAGIFIRGNSMFTNGLSNTALGIDLGANGLNANDACDPDGGANLLQNYPVPTNAISAGSATRIRGTLNSTASSTFLIQFYANTEKAASGYGEGRIYIGSINVTTDGGCNAHFSVVLPVAVPVGQFISATATDAANNTSEFGTNITVAAAQLPTIVTQPQNQSVPFGSNVTFTVAASGTDPLAYQWRFHGTNLAGATATALTLFDVHPTNAGPYSVTVSNPFGSTNSATVSLSVQVNPAALSAALSGGQLQISWPTNSPGFVLQQTTNLAPLIVWSSVTNVPTVVGGRFVVTLPPSGGNRFYRLALP